jgi:hypothetical protein
MARATRPDNIVRNRGVVGKFGEGTKGREFWEILGKGGYPIFELKRDKMLVKMCILGPFWPYETGKRSKMA